MILGPGYSIGSSSVLLNLDDECLLFQEKT